MGMRYRAPFGVMHNSALTCTRAVCSESGYFAGNGQSVRPSVRQPLKGSRNFLRSHGNGRKGGRPSLDSLSLVTLSCPHSPLTHFLARARSHSWKYGRWHTRESIMSEHPLGLRPGFIHGRNRDHRRTSSRWSGEGGDGATEGMGERGALAG